MMRENKNVGEVESTNQWLAVAASSKMVPTNKK